MNVVTRRWWKRGMAVGMLLLTAVMLSACVDVNQQSTIGSDFKGTTMMKVGVSKAFLQTISTIGNSLGGTPTPGSTPPPSSGSGSPDDPFADLTKQVTGMGGTATPYDDGNFMGVQISMPFSSLDEMQNQINMILGSSSMGSSGSPSSSPSGGQDGILQITAKDTGSSVRIDGKVNPLDLSDASNSSGGSSSSSSAGLPPGLDLSSLISGGGQVLISFTMPGKINSADTLAKQNGNTVSWAFKVGDKAATIFVESDKS